MSGNNDNGKLTLTTSYYRSAPTTKPDTSRQWAVSPRESTELFERLFRLERDHLEARSSYYAGESDRMNPVPRGVNPLGTDADTHFATERNYFLMVERGRAAVRNHPLVESGVNRLGANLRLGEFTLDVNSGDPTLDADQKADWLLFTGETQAGRNLCDYEGERDFAALACQSFFSQVVDGDIIHLPLFDGRLQTFESHHLRNPYGHRATGEADNGIIHGVEIRGGRVAGYWLTPNYVSPYGSITQRHKSRFFEATDQDGNKIVFHIGFMHRFQQRRGISRFSPPRDAMNGFEDSNFAHIKSMLKRALLSYWLEEKEQTGQNPFTAEKDREDSGIPQAGDRYATDHGLGLRSIIVEQAGQPAQVFDLPIGKTMKGVDANIPTPQWFEHASLMLTMLSVNLDIPLMFLLLDGSKVNFHGGRMITDQIRLRFTQLQDMQRKGLWGPTYEIRTRQRLTPGHPLFDRALATAVERGANPFRYVFRPTGWPYVKPLEDAAAEDLAEKRNLKSLRRILANRGVDYDDHRREVIGDRASWLGEGFEQAVLLQKRFSDRIDESEIPALARELAYGNQTGGVQVALTGSIGGESEAKSVDQQGQPMQPEGEDEEK